MRPVLVPLVTGVLGLIVLLSLGVWQVQRLQWKEGVLARIDARIDGAPQPLPETPTEENDEYLAVRVEGRFTGEGVDVLTSIKERGPGFRLVSVFETATGRRILVDRGYIPETAKDDPRPETEANVVGNLLWPDEVDGFTPDPDFGRNIWFARDLPAMAAALNTEPVLVVLRDTSETRPAATPLPVDSAGVPNDHLQYAITWFSLAAIWVLMTGTYIRRARRTATGKA